MASDEDVQFSLLWNNYSTNLCTGLYDLLQRDDFVDVTLAAEGQLIKAHRIVLSLCSPYFQQMFTQMPHNQHAFVFLKDVPHIVLKDLIQFMYCGEVNVDQAILPTFISIAEALQIKGLTENDEPNLTSLQTAATPTHESSEVTSNPFTIVHTQSLDAVAGLDTIQTAPKNMAKMKQKTKRPTALANANQSVLKRKKIESTQCVPSTSGQSSNTDQEARSSLKSKLKELLATKVAAKLPTGSPVNRQTVNNSDPIISIKSEPNYENSDEVGEISTKEIKLENVTQNEDYFTTNNETANNGEDELAEEELSKSPESMRHKVKFIAGKTNKILVVDGHKFYKSKVNKDCTLWVCRCRKPLGCLAKCRTSIDDRNIRYLDLNHNHGVNTLSKETTPVKKITLSKALN